MLLRRAVDSSPRAEALQADLAALRAEQAALREELLVRLDTLSLGQLRARVFTLELAAMEARLTGAAAAPAAEPPPALVIGAGAHARVVIEAARAMGGLRLAGLVDPQPPGAEVLGLAVLGDDDSLPALRAGGIGAALLGIGANAARERAGLAARAMGFALPPVIHPTALISPSARIGAGAVIMARAVLGAGAVVEAFAVVNTGAVVEHDGCIGQAAHVAPGAALAGGVRVGPRALLGVGCAVRPGIAIGADAVIGAGAAVVADIAAGVTAAGVPARPRATAP